MKKWIFFALAMFVFLPAKTQNLNSLIGKTYERTFYAAAFKHKASYTFYKNKIKYHVEGVFVNDTYYIIGRYEKDRFVGKDPKTGNHYVVHIEIVSPTRIRINKEGVDPRYQSILRNKPVKGWHDYVLKK